MIKLSALLETLKNRLEVGLLNEDSNWLDRIRHERYRKLAEEWPMLQEGVNSKESWDEALYSEIRTRGRISAFLKELAESNPWVPADSWDIETVFSNAWPECTGIRQYDGMAPIVVLSQFWLSFIWDMTSTRFYESDDLEVEAILSCLTLAHYGSLLDAKVSDHALPNPHALIPESVGEPYRHLVSVKTQTKFVIAHEISHFILENHRSATTHLGELISKRWLNQLRERSQRVLGVPTDVLSVPKEIEADMLACILSLGSVADLGSSESREKICDCYFFLWCCNWLEAIVQPVHAETDPVRPWSQRFFGFRSNISIRYPWVKETILSFDKELGDSLGPGAATCQELFPTLLNQRAGGR
jgi:hypothetical protein